MEGSPKEACGRERHLGEATPWEREIYGLELKMAQSKQELEGAYTLTHNEYVCRDYMPPHPSGMRLSIYHALPTTKTFVSAKNRWDTSELRYRRDS